MDDLLSNVVRKDGVDRKYACLMNQHDETMSPLVTEDVDKFIVVKLCIFCIGFCLISVLRCSDNWYLSWRISAACTTEDFDTTGEVPLSNSLNIRLYSNSNSFDVADVHGRESLEFYSRHQEAQEDRAAVRAEIEILRRERLAYKQESIETRQALARSETYNSALEARIRVLENQAYHHEWQRQDANDRVIEHIMCTQALEAEAHVDTLEDTGSST
ncbi:hypothetical protein Tco_1472268 [Tanacetum coccineum]